MKDIKSYDEPTCTVANGVYFFPYGDRIGYQTTDPGCCPHSDSTSNDMWLKLTLTERVPVWTIILINREDGTSAYLRLDGYEFHVGDPGDSWTASACGAYPVSSSGIYSCYGKYGSQVALYKADNTQYFHVCQIKVYSQTANLPLPSMTQSTCDGCCSVDVLADWQTRWRQPESCTLIRMAGPGRGVAEPFFLMTFTTSRYIETVAILGSTIDFGYSDSTISQKWILQVGDDPSNLTEIDRWKTHDSGWDADGMGREVVVKRYAQHVKLVWMVSVWNPNYDVFHFRYIGIFSNCAAPPFTWTGPSSATFVAHKSETKIYTLDIKPLENCNFWYEPTLMGIYPLPPYIEYSSGVLTVTISPTETSGESLIYIKAQVRDEHGVSFRSETKQVLIVNFNCQNAVITMNAATDMTIAAGGAAVSQTISATTLFDECGVLVFSAVEAYPFITFIALDSRSALLTALPSADPAGTYSLTVVASLADFPTVKPASTTINLTLQNNKPFFETKLPQTLSVFQTEKPESWSFTLPRIKDADNDQVRLIVNFRDAAAFMTQSGDDSIEIKDLSLAHPGTYILTFTLDDRKDQSERGELPKFDLLLLVFPIPELAEKSERVQSNETLANGQNQTSSDSPTIDGNQTLTGNQTVYENGTVFGDSGLSNATEPIQKEAEEVTLEEARQNGFITASWQIRSGQELEPIFLKEQDPEVTVPEVVIEFMQRLMSQQQQPIRAKEDQLKAAVERCTPSEWTAEPISEATEAVDLKFFHFVDLRRSDYLVEEIKRTGSIQMQIFKADPSQPVSDFDWDIVQDSEHNLIMTVNFTQPETISPSTLEMDRLRVLFKDASQYIICPYLAQSSARSLAAMPKDFEVFIKLPSLYNSQAGVVTEAAEVLDSSDGRGIVVSSMVANYAVGMSANLLWGGINGLQLVAVLTIFNVLVPPNSKRLLQVIQTLVTFDMFYDIWDPNDHIPFSVTTPFSDNFCAVKYCSLGYFDALGSVAVFLFAKVVYWALIPLIRYLALRTGCVHWKCCISVRQRRGIWGQDQVTVTGEIIRISLENYITYLTAGVLSLYYRSQIEKVYGKPTSTTK